MFIWNQTEPCNLQEVLNLCSGLPSELVRCWLSLAAACPGICSCVEGQTKVMGSNPEHLAQPCRNTVTVALPAVFLACCQSSMVGTRCKPISFFRAHLLSSILSFPFGYCEEMQWNSSHMQFPAQLHILTLFPCLKHH